MLIQALITVDDLVKALTEVTPLRIALDAEAPDRYVWLARPTSVTLIPERGIRVVMSAYLQWDVVGITVPVVVRTAELLLRPTVVKVEGKDILSLRAEIERLDLSHVPSLVEAPIVAALNTKLAEPDATIPWKFMETLDFTFNIPNTLAPLEQVHLFTLDGEARITGDAVVLQVRLDFDAKRSDKPDLKVPDELLALGESGESGPIGRMSTAVNAL